MQISGYVCSALVGLVLCAPAAAQLVGPMEDLGTLGGNNSGGGAVSADGLTVVGSSDIDATGQDHAFRWTAVGGMEDLGTLGGSNSVATAVSADGSVVVGTSNIGAIYHAFRWTAEGGMEDLVALGEVSNIRTLTVSADGTAVVGHMASDSVVGTQAFRWTASGGIENLGSLGGDYSQAIAVSADGSVVAGDSQIAPSSTTHAFRWTAAGGMEDLGSLGSFHSSQVKAISADGSVVVGNSALNSTGQSAAFRWTAGGGMQDIGNLSGFWAIAQDVSDDGSVVVGLSNNATGFRTRAFRWTTTGGMQNLGTLGGGIGDESQAQHVSADGFVVTGHSDNQGAELANRVFRWSVDHGMTDIGSLGGDNASVAGITSDGDVIVGGASTAEGRTHAFRFDISDTDEDGLLDDWEINGIPYVDVNGVPQRLILPNADPLRKDLYVEVDSKTGFGLSNEAIVFLEDAFANSPMGNPDNPDGTSNLNGITLHIIPGETNLPLDAVWLTDGCWPLDFDLWRGVYFGADGDDDNLISAKSLAYRYCIIADTSDNPATTDIDAVGGCGETPGDNFVMFFGTLGAVPMPIDEASLFMHELGHNLGLRHGGGDDINGKPNYPSIMNYVLSYKYDWCKDFWELDYSRTEAGDFPVLFEQILNENNGIGSSGGYYADYLMPFGVQEFDSTGVSARGFRYLQLDGSTSTWDGAVTDPTTDYGDTAGSLFQDSQLTNFVLQDLNYVTSAIGVPPNIPDKSSPNETMLPYNDWASVGLKLRAAIGDSASAPSFPSDEITEDARNWINANFPSPTSSCVADVNGDGTVSPADFTAWIAAFNAMAPECDQNGDGSCTPADFTAWIANFNAGC